MVFVVANPCSHTKVEEKQHLGAFAKVTENCLFIKSSEIVFVQNSHVDWDRKT